MADRGGLADAEKTGDQVDRDEVHVRLCTEPLGFFLFLLFFLEVIIVVAVQVTGELPGLVV